MLVTSTLLGYRIRFFQVTDEFLFDQPFLAMVVACDGAMMIVT
jgi:hypothetical protein